MYYEKHWKPIPVAPTMSNWKFFIANRIHFDKESRKKATPPAIRVAVAGVALGLAVMILSVAIVLGFKHEIRNKVVGFGAHIQISAFENNVTYEKQPVQYTDSLHGVLAAYDGINRIDPVGTKPGVIKTDSDFMGVVLKGVTPKFDWAFFQKYLVDGCIPAFQDSTTSNEVLVSQMIADKMQLQVGDKIYCYFVQQEGKYYSRRFTLSGIYKTDFTEYDKLLMVGDVRHIQKINGWNPDQYSEIELTLSNFNRIDAVTDELYMRLIDHPDDYGIYYYPQSIRTLNPAFFSWLDLLDMNVWIILILMAVVAGFTMISGLLIIILERANMIGVLKALGANNTSIRKIFLYVSVFLVGKGMLWGNLIGIGICLLQQQFHFIALDPEAYYVPYVPIDLNFLHILWLNMGCMVISVLMLVGPSYLVSRIRPAKSIKFE